ncbi:MAG: rhamnose utilization protein RhaD (predicted bifunctional aldolase and dehydrogenase) [Granulosicoccus sp.]
MPELDVNSEFKALKRFSKKIGSDPLQVQGAGGNTSIKIDHTLWIKASGTWLMNAQSTNLFVPVTLNPLLTALREQDPRAQKSTAFVLEDHNPDGLRPSIETTVHAVFTQKVVAHTHCVDTIALAVQINAEQQLSQLLNGYDWLWVPYAKPGIQLSSYIKQHMTSNTNVVILGNHGLIVAADTVAETETLMLSVRAALHQAHSYPDVVNYDQLSEYCRGSNYLPAPDERTHAIALNPDSIKIAENGSLYPDHVIFLGDGSIVAGKQESLDDVISRVRRQTGNDPLSILVPEQGVLMKSDATPGQHAMARCITEVTARLIPSADIHYLTAQNVYELLNWEAEHYRQSLET